MPYQKFNYASIPPHIINGPLHGIDFGDLLKQGMQLRHEPQRLLAQREQEQLANALSRQGLERGAVESEFQRPMAEGKLRSLQQANELQVPMGLSKINAQEQKAFLDKLRAQLEPHKVEADINYKNERIKALGGVKSDIGKMLNDYEKIVNEKGEKSNQAVAFKKAMDSKIKAAENRGSTSIEKNFNAMEARRKIINDPNASPEDKFRAKMELATLESQEFKDKVPASMYPKLQAGNVMQVLMDDIDIKDATRYSGILAKPQKKYDQAAGNDHWVKYHAAEGKMKSLAGQIRAFLGGSVQPIEMKRLLDFLDGNDWSLSPAQAEKLMKSSFSTLTKEHIAYVKNAKNPSNLLIPPRNKYEGDNNIPEINTSTWKINK